MSFCYPQTQFILHYRSGAAKEALIYTDVGIDALMIENMHDAPYLNKHVGPEITACMTSIGLVIKGLCPNISLGIQILAGANKEALAVAYATNMDFIRAEGFVFAHVADEGIIESCAGELLRYRKQIGAQEVQEVLVFTDIKKKHSSHSITADTDIAETVHAAKFFLSDGVIVTGKSTGCEADIEELKEIKEKVEIPVLVGSGVTAENVGTYLGIADAVIVGSYFKKDGLWLNKIDEEKVKKFMDIAGKFL